MKCARHIWEKWHICPSTLLSCSSIIVKISIVNSMSHWSEENICEIVKMLCWWNVLCCTLLGIKSLLLLCMFSFSHCSAVISLYIKCQMDLYMCGCMLWHVNTSFMHCWPCLELKWKTENRRCCTGSAALQGSWGQHGAHLGPIGPRWAPCWPHEPCYLGSAALQLIWDAMMLMRHHPYKSLKAIPHIMREIAVNISSLVLQTQFIGKWLKFMGNIPMI